MQLRSKVLAIAAAVMLCAIGAVIATSARLSAREYEAALESRSLAIGKSLQIQLERVLQFGIAIDNIEGFEEQCDNLVSSFPGIGFAMVVAPDGHVLFKSREAPVGEGIIDRKFATALHGGAERMVTNQALGVTWHNALLPARNPQGERVGSVVVGFRSELISGKVDAMLWSNIAVGVTALVAGLLALYAAMAICVTRPLGSLIDTILTLRASPRDLGRRAAVRSGDELGRLANAFNRLMDELQQTTVSKVERERAMDELRKVSDALFEQKERAEVTLRAIADAVITTDAAARMQYLNPAAERLTGWTLEAARGRSLNDCVTLIDMKTRQVVDDLLAPSPPVNPADPGSDLELLRHDGSTVAVRHTSGDMRSRTGDRSGTVLTLRDVSLERSLAERRAWEASHDVLTGLANRRAFGTRVEAALQSAQDVGRQHVVCFMDLDRFKIVNDMCGHSAGDELLKELVALLKLRVRESDFFARLGGDEFALLLEGCPLDRAQLIAADLIAAVGDFRFDCKGKIFSVGLSVGLAMLTGEDGAAEVLAMADTACYWAKEQGRNRVCVYRTGDSEMAARRREVGWVSRINSALAENRFELYHQTYLPLRNESLSEAHLEVLLRMVDEDGKLVQPGSFLPAAERFNLMPLIDRWVISKVFAGYRQLASERGEQGLICSINLSGTSLNAQGLAEFVRQQVEAHAVPPGCICFEITETAAINNLRSAADFIEKCKSLGILFALDDFGTGTSSFGYLKNLAVDYLKIDGSFVKNLESNEIDKAMTEAMNRIGQVMGIKTVAEYAENEGIIDALRSIGVDYAQGYAVSRPQPLFPNPTVTRVRSAGETVTVP